MWCSMSSARPLVRCQCPDANRRRTARETVASPRSRPSWALADRSLPPTAISSCATLPPSWRSSRSWAMALSGGFAVRCSGAIGTRRSRIRANTSDGPGSRRPVVSLAPEKHLFLNVPRKRSVVSLCGKSFAISTNGPIRSESGRLFSVFDFQNFSSLFGKPCSRFANRCSRFSHGGLGQSTLVGSLGVAHKLGKAGVASDRPDLVRGGIDNRRCVHPC